MTDLPDEAHPHPHSHVHRPPRGTLTPYLRRIAMAMAVLVAVTWVLGLFAITQLGRVQERSRDTNEQALQSAQVLGQMAIDVATLRILEGRSLLDLSEVEPLQRRAEFRGIESRITTAIRRFESLDSSDEEMRLFMRFLSDWYAYDRLARASIERPPSGGRRGVVPVLVQSKERFDAASATLAQLVRINVEKGRAAQQDSEEIYHSSVILIAAAMAAATLLITAMLLLIVWHESK